MTENTDQEKPVFIKTGSGRGELKEHARGKNRKTVYARGCLHPDYEEVIRYFENDQVYAVQIESCLACQQGCRYCYASAQDAPSTELPADCIRRILVEALDSGARAIDWLGGDPLMRPDWFELACNAQELGLINNIWTSGIPLADPAVAEQVCRVTKGGFVSVHLDTLDPWIYASLHTGDATRKIRAILEGIQNILDLGKPPNEVINCITFTRPLAGKDIEDTIRFFADKGIRTCLTQVCMAGSASDHPQWIPAVDQIKHAFSVRDQYNYPESDLSMSSMDVNKFYCGGMVCVTVNGDVTPCSVIRQGFGNVSDQPLGDIITRHCRELLFLPLRNEQGEGRCETCRNHQVCWGCRAAAWYTSGDLMADDPNCTYGQKN